MASKNSMSKQSGREHSLVSNLKVDSTENTDLRVLSAKIWIQIGSLIVMTFIFTLGVTFAAVGLLAGKFFGFSDFVLVVIGYLGLIWALILTYYSYRSLRQWDKLCKEFASKLTREYNNSVDSNPMLPIVARHESQKAVLFAMVLYYSLFFAILGIILFSTWNTLKLL